MTVTWLASLEAFLLIAGGLGAYKITSWVARGGVRAGAFMAAVASWSILFGIFPFFAFYLLAREAGPVAGDPGGWQGFVLNLIPFTILAAPAIGFGHGLREYAKVGKRL